MSHPSRSLTRAFPLRPRGWVRALLILLCAAGAGQALAASGSAAIEAVRSNLASANLDDAQRQGAAAMLDEAAANEQAAGEFTARAAKLQREAAEEPDRSRQLRRSLETDRDRALRDWAARLPRQAEAETLERVLAQERSIIAGLTTQIDAASEALAELLSGPALATTDAVALRQRIDELSAPVVAVEGEPAVLTDVRRVARASELRRDKAELALRELEMATAVARQRLLELTISELEHREAIHSARVDHLRGEIADLGRRAIESLIQTLAAREQQLADATGVLADALARNHALGQELAVQNERLVATRDELALQEAARERTDASLRDSQARLELGASNEQVGRWLWSERRRLIPVNQLQQRLDGIRSELANARLRLVDLSEESRRLLNVQDTIDDLIANAPEAAEDEQHTRVARDALEPVLADRTAVLGLLKPLFERHIETLEHTEQALQAQIDDSRRLQQLLDRHLLWIASHRPVDTAWLERIPQAIADLVKPTRYTAMLDLLAAELRERPLRWLSAALMLLVLLECRRRAPARIEAEAPITRQIRRDNYRATARTLGWTLLAAAPAAFVVHQLGLLALAAGEPGRFTNSVGAALVSLAGPLLAVAVLHWTAVERGLGHAHFRWLRARREALRRLLIPAASVVLPAYFLTRLAFNRNLELSNDVEARLAIVVACLTLAWALWRALAPGRIWVVRGVETEPSRLRRLLRVGLPLGALAVAGLALYGYVYSAGLVLRAMLSTFSLSVALGIVFGLLGRWLLLGERRIAWSRMEEERRAAAEHTEPLPEAEPEITLEKINAQTSRLLRAFRWTFVAVGLLWVWVELLPAFARLDEIALWSMSDTAADGSAIQVPVTLMQLLLGVLALALTVIGSSNLPGLIEIGLLSRTHIDAPTRYAVTSILRYAIVIAGTMIGLGMLGMRWSQLQWMAAALTVGLGFGLQEIFANFVSGLILLFERPFRVGDIITIGDLSGRVTRIRTRATTIVDFENKEIVVPNKNFITGQLINWTLTDTTTRVTIKVGVDYGTDARKVLELLMRAAREHPLVLADPEPQTWFLTFGANSLDFELRVFVANIGDRLITQNELNIRIADLFAEHGINMAFPQLDLHIRHLPEGFGPAAPPAASPG